VADAAGRALAGGVDVRRGRQPRIPRERRQRRLAHQEVDRVFDRVVQQSRAHHVRIGDPVVTENPDRDPQRMIGGKPVVTVGDEQ